MSRLVLVSDGGIFARERPREKGGAVAIVLAVTVIYLASQITVTAINCLTPQSLLLTLFTSSSSCSHVIRIVLTGKWISLNGNIQAARSG